MASIPHVEQVPADAPVGVAFWLVGKLVEVTAPGVLWDPCGRCGGEGRLSWAAHVHGGVCFECNGAKGVQRTVEAENKLARNRTTAAARRETKRLAKLAEVDRKITEIVAAHPLVGEAIRLKAEIEAAANDVDEWVEYGALGRAVSFLADMRRFGDLFAWKIEVIEESVAAYHAEQAAEQRAAEEAARAARHPAPLGKDVEVVGEVVNLSGQESVHNGREVYTPKMLVITDAGWKCYITEPRNLDPRRGDRVFFVAELTEGRDGDPQFRIGKRPRQACIVERTDA